MTAKKQKKQNKKPTQNKNKQTNKQTKKQESRGCFVFTRSVTSKIESSSLTYLLGKLTEVYFACLMQTLQNESTSALSIPSCSPTTG